MPYNSQSPVILKLNQFFANPRANAGPNGSNRLRAGVALSARASDPVNAIANAQEAAHLAEWPQDHQELLRLVLIHSIDSNIPTSFAWEETQNRNQTRTVIVSFDGKMGVTGRSPYYI